MEFGGMAIRCLPLLLLAIILTGVSVTAKTAGYAPLGHKNYIGYQLFRTYPKSAYEHSLLANVTHLRAAVAADAPTTTPSRMRTTRTDSETRTGPISITHITRDPTGPVDMFVAPEARPAFLDYLRRAGIEHSVQVDDVGQHIVTEARSMMRVAVRNRLDTGDREFDLNVYHSHEEIVDYVRSVAERHKDFVELGSMGRSFEGREMPYLKIGYPPARPTNKKKSLLVDGGFHAREWISPATALHLIHRLTTDPKLTPLLRSIDIYVLPLVNPDGYEWSRTADRMWRGTRSKPATAWECYGADPNRNFPYMWNTTGASEYSCDEDYHGRSALSEVECRQLAGFIEENAVTGLLRGYLSLHAYGNAIIHPWAYQLHYYPSDVAELLAVGHRAKNAMLRAGGPQYTVGSASDLLYEASGSSMDYAKSVGVKYAYVMELTNVRGFLLPSFLIEESALPVVEGMLVVAGAVRDGR